MPRKPPYIVFTQPLPTKGQYKIYSVATSESLGMIKGDNRKRYWEAFDNEGNFLKSAERKKQLMDFFREIDKKNRMAEGGGIGFEKLSDKVAKNYEGKKVAPKYQHEYGKTYSRAEAKEVGDKVAGKVYWQQQGRMATGGNIKKYEYSPSIEEQKTWDEKKTRIYDAYVNSYNSYQDLLQERKRAIGRNDKDEVKSIDLRLKNKLLAIRFAYSELKGRFYEEDFKDGGNLDSLDARISKAIFQAYGDIDDAIEFKFNDPDSGVAPYRLVFLAVQKGFITPEEINKDVLNSAYETSSETADAEEIGSSDMNFYVWSMLRDAGFDMKVENGTYIRVRNKMATGGTTDKMDEYIRKNRERQAKEEQGKYFAPYRAFVYEDSYQFADFKTDDFHKAVKWAKETLKSQRAYRKNTENMWAIVDEFTPIEERNNVIYPYKEVARFTEEDSKEMKFGNGGNTTFYYDQAKKTLGEHLYNHIASLNKEQLEKHLSHLQKEIERMKANDTEFTKQEFLPKYKQEEKFILYLLERLDEFKYADGGNVDEDKTYDRTFRNNAGKDVRVKIVKNPIFGKYDYWVDGSVRGQFDTYDEARAEVNYENFDMYKDGGNIYSKEESLQIARTILQQMGGKNRLVAFTGAYGFAYADGGVSFRIKNRKVNYVKVKLNGKDLYDVTFGRVSGTNFKVVEQLDDVYAEDLIDIFQKSTGMYLRFQKGGIMARGGLVVTSIKDIPNFKEENEAGRITYRGLGMGKLSNDFYKIAGESGTRIKVKGKEYYITNSEFDTFSRDSSGKMRIKFDAPHRRFEKGGVFNSEFYKEGGSVKKQKYAYVQAKTTSGKNVFKFFEEVPTHKQVYAYFKTVKDENGNPIILNDTSIHVEEESDFNRDLFLEKANEIAIRTFGSPIKELDDMMFSFDKNSLSVFKFEAELENGMEVTIQTVDGMIVIEAEEEDEDKFKDGGSIDINFATDTNYIKRENIKIVKYKNGKELYNWDYWDSYNVPAEKDELFSGIYVAHRPLPEKDADKQYSMFKKGGNLTKTEKDKLPKSAFYIKRSDIDSVIIYDEKLGEEVEIPANRIVNGIWFDNNRTQRIIDRAKKEGLIPDKTKKTTTFIARFNGKKIELEAKSMFDAEQKALKELKVPKSKRGLLSVMSKQAYERGDFQFN